MQHLRARLIVAVALATAGSALSEPIATSDKIVYEPLSEDARKLNRLAKYVGAPKREVHIALGSLRLTARVPTTCDAYDAVPIEFTLEGDPGNHDRVALEAVAFEEEARRRGRDLFDLAMPGNLKVKIEYLGSQTGVFDPQRVSRLTSESRHTVFPPYRLDPMVRSGRVKRGHYLFFKFRVTNTGDTILDPEGFGGWMAMPQVLAAAADGKPIVRATTINRYERHLKYLYPGESFEPWVSFHTPGSDPAHARTLPIGSFVVQYRLLYRWNTEYDWGVNMWGGRPWFALDVPIEVAEEAGEAGVETREVVLDDSKDRLCRYIRSFEEFMTSFKVYEAEELKSPQRGTMHLQVAPWSQQVVLKLIGNASGSIRTASVPVEVRSANLQIAANPDNPFVVQRGGRAEPAFCTQIMPAMRASTQLGPQPEVHLRQRLKEMMDCGVNVVCTDAGDWHIPEITNADAFVGDIQAETFKYCYDVITPEAGIPLFGWGLFPPKTANTPALGSFFLGRKLDVPFLEQAYTYSGRPEVDAAHPDFAAAYAGAILFNYRRWGDQWYRTSDGDVLIDVEDSWGWLRDDINVRYLLGPHAIRRFQTWVKNHYGTIQQVNRFWRTNYRDFSEIDPQKDQGNEGQVFDTDLSAIRPVYNIKEHIFHDWSLPTEEWDFFRTELRCEIYEDILAEVRKVIPRAQLNVRTEGAVIPVYWPEDSPRLHHRHFKLAQRRQALAPEVFRKRQVIRFHSDYTTIPYTELEWTLMLRRLRQQGVRGNYLPQFCTARDMVLNERWGRDCQMNYHLAVPKRAAMLHVLQAAYPVWRIMYEQGHCPGVLWEDYMCDGFVTETQKRELRLFREHLNKPGPASRPS